MVTILITQAIHHLEAAISACEKANEWQSALNLYSAMQLQRESGDIITFGATISACEKASCWQEALALLAILKQRSECYRTKEC